MSKSENLQIGGSSFPSLQPQPLARQKKVAVLTAAALEALEVAEVLAQVQKAQRR